MKNGITEILLYIKNIPCLITNEGYFGTCCHLSSLQKAKNFVTSSGLTFGLKISDPVVKHPMSYGFTPNDIAVLQ